jgi:hypothetical protein
VSRDDIRTLTGSNAKATDQNYTPVTGTQVGATLTPATVSEKRAADVATYPGALHTITEVVDSVVTFMGETLEQSPATSAAIWRIKRISTVAGTTTIQYAGTGAFNQIWDDRASLSFPDLSTVCRDKAVNVLGHNTEVNLAAAEDVWDFGGDYPFPTVASTLSIVSDNVNDTLLGTGARQLLVEGLDSGFNEISETINLDGVTPVVTVSSYLRLNSIKVTSAGNTGKNEGTIDASAGASVVGRILPLFNRTLSSIFTVPEGKLAKVHYLVSSISHLSNAFGEKQGELVFFVRPENEPFMPEQIVTLGTQGTSAGPVIQFPVPLECAARTDLKMRFTAFDNNTFVTASYFIVLEDAG